jgi:hypothetical protein
MRYPVITIDGVTEKVAPSIAITHYLEYLAKKLKKTNQSCQAIPKKTSDSNKRSNRRLNIIQKRKERARTLLLISQLLSCQHLLVSLL